MIFLVLFGLIAIIVIGLNIYDNSNLKTIEEYMKKQGCENLYYSKGSFKGICKTEIIEIKNSFNVDLVKNRRSFKLEDINKIDEKEYSIIINSTYNLEFKEKKNREEFLKKLKEKINK